jgi:hypothetical protein
VTVSSLGTGRDATMRILPDLSLMWSAIRATSCSTRPARTARRKNCSM